VSVDAMRHLKDQLERRTWELQVNIQRQQQELGTIREQLRLVQFGQAGALVPGGTLLVPASVLVAPVLPAVPGAVYAAQPATATASGTLHSPHPAQQYIQIQRARVQPCSSQAPGQLFLPPAYSRQHHHHHQQHQQHQQQQHQQQQQQQQHHHQQHHHQQQHQQHHQHQQQQHQRTRWEVHFFRQGN
ncbi:unnamed protein product, partial [Lampetra fluviatilis]